MMYNNLFMITTIVLIKIGLIERKRTDAGLAYTTNFWLYVSL